MPEQMRMGPGGPAWPGGVPPAGRPPRPRTSAGSGAERAEGGVESFRQALDRALAAPAAAPAAQAAGALRLSAHAQQRLAAGGRTLTAGELAQVAGALERLAARGARESLVLLSDLALVVSVPSRTVITAVTADRMKENIFTQIDSAVIL